MNFTPALRIPEYGGKHGPSSRKPPEGNSPTGGTEKKQGGSENKQDRTCIDFRATLFQIRKECGSWRGLSIKKGERNAHCESLTDII